MYYVYMLRCKDNSIYTGITTDLERRVEEHITKSEKCAKYTMNHPAEKLEMAWKTENRVNASKLEYWVKQLTKKQKEDLIKDTSIFEELFSPRLDSTCYKPTTAKI